MADRRPTSPQDPPMGREEDSGRPSLPEKVPLGTLRHVSKTVTPREYHASQSQNDGARDESNRGENLSHSGHGGATGFTKVGLSDDLSHGDPPAIPERMTKDPRKQRSGYATGPARAESFNPENSEFPPHHIPRVDSLDSLPEGHPRVRQLENELQTLMDTMGVLNAQIKSLTARAEISEEKQERAEHALGERIKAGVDLNEMLKSTERLTADMVKTKKENEELKDQLQDAQSHIFSLQPYRKDVTSEEVGREYTNFIEGIADWVSKFMAPLLDNHQDTLETMSAGLRKRPADATKVKRAIHQSPDLFHALQYPESDEDIVLSLILRHLYRRVFQKTLYGAASETTALLLEIQRSMQEHVEPKRDLFSTRTWTAEALTALISAPGFRPVRESKEKEITRELVDLLDIFCSSGRFDEFHDGFALYCVRPAMQLHEKFLLSTDHFYLDFTSYVSWARDNTGELELSPELHEHIDDLDCKNVVQSRKTFNPRKLNPQPTRTELYHNLENVCTVAPALYMRQIGRHDTVKDPRLVRKQQMLVAWGSEEKRGKFKRNGDRTLLSLIYSANEREGWSGLRWI